MIKEIMALMIIYEAFTGISSEIVTLKQCQEVKKEVENAEGRRYRFGITCIKLKQKEGAE